MTFKVCFANGESCRSSNGNVHTIPTSAGGERVWKEAKYAHAHPEHTLTHAHARTRTTYFFFFFFKYFCCANVVFSLKVVELLAIVLTMVDPVTPCVFIATISSWLNSCTSGNARTLLMRSLVLYSCAADSVRTIERHVGTLKQSTAQDTFSFLIHWIFRWCSAQDQLALLNFKDRSPRVTNDGVNYYILFSNLDTCSFFQLSKCRSLIISIQQNLRSLLDACLHICDWACTTTCTFLHTRACAKTSEVCWKKNNLFHYECFKIYVYNRGMFVLGYFWSWKTGLKCSPPLSTKNGLLSMLVRPSFFFVSKTSSFTLGVLRLYKKNAAAPPMPTRAAAEAATKFWQHVRKLRLGHITKHMYIPPAAIAILALSPSPELLDCDSSWVTAMPVVGCAAHNWPAGQ